MRDWVVNDVRRQGESGTSVRAIQSGRDVQITGTIGKHIALARIAIAVAIHAHTVVGE